MTSIDLESGVATIRFDDGGMNLLGSDSLRELHSILDRVGETEAIVFSSGRPGLFAAGADMEELISFDRLDAERFSLLGQQLMSRIERSKAFTIAVVDGDCFGGALDLLLSFDLRVATPSSRFSHPGARLGIVTGFGGTRRWRSVVAPRGAIDLFLENRILTASSALESGILTHVTESPESLVDERLGRWRERWRDLSPVLRELLYGVEERAAGEVC